jgi:hypothetical protein
MSLHNVTRGIELSIHRVAREEEIAPAVNAAKASDAGAINMLASALFSNNRTIIFDRIATLSLPAVYQWPEWAEEGGLIGYGPRLVHLYRDVMSRALAALLRGTKPADLPVEQPTRFRAGDQSQDCKGARPRNSADAARGRRRGDRVKRREFIAVSSTYPLRRIAHYCVGKKLNFSKRACRLFPMWECCGIPSSAKSSFVPRRPPHRRPELRCTPCRYRIHKTSTRPLTASREHLIQGVVVLILERTYGQCDALRKAQLQFHPRHRASRGHRPVA